MRFFFRVDSSGKIGSGHLMRCLTLAGQLRKMGADEVGFISRDLEGNMLPLIERLGYTFFVLPRHDEQQDLEGYAAWLTVSQEIDAQETIVLLQKQGRIDWLIVDSYAIDKSWEKMIRPHVQQIMTIDDLANREHDVDVLLDQNYAPGRAKDYDGLVPAHCLRLMGLDYLLIREEFYEAANAKRTRTGAIKRLFVFFGGSDLTNETSKTLEAMESFPSLEVDVVVGGGNLQAHAIAEKCSAHENWHFHYQIDYIASLMAQADLAIGAGGTTTWERCFLGLPSLVISIADNQSGGAEFYDSQGFIKYLGEAGQVTATDIVKSVRQFQQDANICCKMQENMRKLFKCHVPCKVAGMLVRGLE